MVGYVRYCCKQAMFEVLTDMNILYDAFIKSIKSVSWKSSIQKYECNVLPEIYKLRQSLIDGTYKQKPFYEFDICERGKHRHIKSLHISDRVLQRAICDYILMPILSKYLIYDNGASVLGKGVDFTRRRLVAHLQKFYRKHGNKGYILICDFKKYFDTIPHEKLIKQLSEYIDDEKVISLLDDLISSFGEGIGIGSQISQVMGIFYPLKIDNFIKIVKGCKYYGRYNDDFYIIHEDKEYLKRLLEEINEIAENLGLKINKHKTQIYPINKDFTYLKLRHHVTETGKVVRKPCHDSITRERRKIKKFYKNGVPFEDALYSYKTWRGNIKKYNGYNAIKKTDEIFDWYFGKEMYLFKLRYK